VATPKPEDQERLSGIDREIVFLTASGDYDTSGHAISDELELDVEGHAITLRLPTPADADALRKALLIGAVSATIVAAGAIASLQGSPAPITSQAQAPAAPIAVPAPGPDMAAQREDRMAAQDPMWDTQVSGAPTSAGSSDVSGPTSADTHGPGRGALERNP
jgi:hypothetical protein